MSLPSYILKVESDVIRTTVYTFKTKDYIDWRCHEEFTTTTLYY
jgi:hypothetical protein